MNINFIIENVNTTQFSNIILFLTKHKTIILENWFKNSRVKFILDNLNISISEYEFNNLYGEKIFNTILTIFKNNIKDIECPTIKLLISKIDNYDNIPQIISLLCTQLKNEIIYILINDNNGNYKNEIFYILTTILDINLSNILKDYNQSVHNITVESLKHARLLEESTVVSKTDLSGNITFVSDSFCEILGYTKEELIGRPHNVVRHPDTKPSFFKKMWTHILKGNIWQGKLKNLTKDGRTIIIETKIIPEYNHEHELIGFVAIRNDITDKFLARTDKLTKIMNRLRFDEEFLKKKELSEFEQKPLHMIILDIDKFKNVNDTYGHVVGDEILKEFAVQVKKIIRPTDIFARWGGEEFVLLLYGLNYQTSIFTAERIRKHIEKHTFATVGNVTASFGVAEYSHEYKTSDEFFDMVDKCLYNSKTNGRNKVSYLENGIIKTL